MAAWKLGVKRIVWASSETALGLPFDEVRYVPVDEADHPLPNSTYSLSKVMTETMAAEVSRWAGIPVIGRRFSTIFTPDDYVMQPSFATTPEARRWNLFGYIDSRDVASSCEAALTARLEGAHSFIIAADDTILDVPTREALGRIHPHLHVPDEVAPAEQSGCCRPARLAATPQLARGVTRRVSADRGGRRAGARPRAGGRYPRAATRAATTAGRPRAAARRGRPEAATTNRVPPGPRP